MRDILDKLTIISESVGLANRKPGDVFKNPAGDTITFSGLEFYPQGGGELTPDEIDSLISDFETQMPGIEWQNNRNAKSGGIVIAVFDGEEGPRYFGFFLRSIKRNPRENSLPNQVGDYKLASKAAAKVQAKLTPQDLLTDMEDLDIKSIMIQLSESLGTDDPMYYVAHQVATGAGFPIEVEAPEDASFTAFRDYFCEILQPIALQTGMFDGNGLDAANKFLGVDSFAGTRISFSFDKTAGLADSELSLPDGRSIKVSSKGAQGATASVGNLLNVIRDIDDPKLLEKYKNVVDIFETIEKYGQRMAPLILARKYKLIDKSDIDDMVALKDNPSDRHWSSIEEVKKLKYRGFISDKLLEFAASRKTKEPEIDLYYAAMSGIAHAVADKINKSTNFSEAASQILNNGALVQVYTKASQSGKKWILQGFTSQYPGEAVTGVKLSADKTYYSTGIKGNFTFKILRNGAKDIDQPSGGEETSAVSPKPNLATSAEKIVTQKSAPRIKRDTEPQPGREKRKK